MVPQFFNSKIAFVLLKEANLYQPVMRQMY
jgi:hypothetical protein